MLRAANTGISAIVDKDGSLLAHSSPMQKEILYGEMPLYENGTLYGILGDVIPVACILYLAILFGYKILKKRNKKEI